MYEFLVSDRNYLNYRFFDNLNNEIMLPINPLKLKLFNNSFFDYDLLSEKITNIQQPIMDDLPGVLLLNKTFGKYKNKFLYKCVPYDTCLPIFLVPYKVVMGFNKDVINKYVRFSFSHWNDKHPQGELIETIGDVNDISAYYQYELVFRKLKYSFKTLQSNAVKHVKQIDETVLSEIKTKYNCEDYTDSNKNYIFTIDPSDCKDFDDAVSISNNTINVYISNVAVWLDYFNLWEHMSERVSTIYLPETKIPMLPTILSDDICSLRKNEKRFALCMSLVIENNEIVNVSFKNTMIKVANNFVYDENKLEKNNNYRLLFNTLTNLKNTFNIKIKDSHDVVMYLMITMNYACSIRLEKNKVGIFREVKIGDNKISPVKINIMPDKVKKFYRLYKNVCAIYTLEPGNYDSIHHDFLESYVHITSPIRRIVDLLNLIQFQTSENIYKFSSDALTFYDMWVNKLLKINLDMKSIRKLQNNAILLQQFNRNSNQIYNAYIYEKNLVYIPEINLLTKINETINHRYCDLIKVKLFYFLNEANFKQKIKVQYI